MPTDVIRYEASGVSFELEQRPSKALRKFGNGRLTICLGSEPIWITCRTSETHGIEWTWGDLLSFFTSNWAWLLNEQGLPLPVKYSPDILVGTAADIWEELAQKNNTEFTKEQKRVLRTFCQRHDLAEAAPGIVLPSLFLMRMGNQLLFSSKKKQVLINIYDGYQLLSQVGDTIHRWMVPYADDGTQPLLDAWETRDKRVKEVLVSKEHLLARMDRDSFGALSCKMNHHWNNTWDGSIMQESEMFAAARMSSGFVSIAQQMDILDAIRICPAINIECIEKVSQYLHNSGLSLSEFDEKNTAYSQGYDLANKLREYLHREEIEPLDPEKILTEFGVRIQEMEWQNTPIDALSCWSDAHGPLILLNVGVGRRCSHEYGRRFTLGHELCHLLVDRSQALGLVDVLGGGMPDFVERRANTFSAEILLPRQLVAGEFKNNNEEADIFLIKMRNQYKVPRKTIASQIYNSSATQYMNDEEYKFFYTEVFTERNDKNEDV